MFASINVVTAVCSTDSIIRQVRPFGALNRNGLRIRGKQQKRYLEIEVCVYILSNQSAVAFTLQNVFDFAISPQ